MKNFVSDYTILIVDDIPTNVMLVQAILKKEGYSLVTAESGVEALQIAQERHPNLILLDIMMPEMDGYEVLQRLKSDPKTNDIPVVIMSALSDMPSIMKGYQLGATEYVTKPFQREELVKRIAHRFELYSVERIKQELESAIEFRDMLYSVVTHDLRAPLGTLKMLNNSALKLIDKEKAGEDVYEMLLTMNKTSEETFQLLENLMNWNKLNQNQTKLHLQKADVNGLIESVISVYIPIAEQKRVTIVAKGLEAVLMGMVDVDKVKTIVRNLLSNSVKFCYEGGTITILSYVKDDCLYFSIKDRGRGIKEEDKPKLFNEKHFSTFGVNGENGSGLGLLICKSFVELHGGKFWFESAVGEDTTFFFSLKIRDDEE